MIHLITSPITLLELGLVQLVSLSVAYMRVTLYSIHACYIQFALEFVTWSLQLDLCLVHSHVFMLLDLNTSVHVTVMSALNF